MGQIENLSGFPGVIHMFFWQLEKEGRLIDAAKDVDIKALLIFGDVPPSTLLTISKGTYRVESFNAPETEELLENQKAEIDVIIMGNIGPILNSKHLILTGIAHLLTRRLRVKGFGKISTILKIFQYKGPFTGGKNI